jgi:hypothetical protein
VVYLEFPDRTYQGFAIWHSTTNRRLAGATVYFDARPPSFAVPLNHVTFLATY